MNLKSELSVVINKFKIYFIDLHSDSVPDPY